MRERRVNDPMVVVPYVAGLSEDIRRVCRRFDIRMVFRSSTTLRNQKLPVNLVWCITFLAVVRRSISVK